jgi:hypothetical protein
MTDGAHLLGADLVLRPLTAPDEAELRRLFRETLVMGRPLPFPLADGGRYEALCLDWYLGVGRQDAAVVDAGGHIVGFALVCTDQAAFSRWVRFRAARYALYSVLTLIRTNPQSPVARFHRCRLRDGWVMWRSPAPPFAAHAHINVSPHQRAGGTGRALVSCVDERCRRAGLSGWYGEINAPVGRRANALERLVGSITHRAPNHTLSWLMGRPVERLTVARSVPSIEAEAG